MVMLGQRMACQATLPTGCNFLVREGKLGEGCVTLYYLCNFTKSKIDPKNKHF